MSIRCFTSCAFFVIVLYAEEFIGIPALLFNEILDYALTKHYRNVEGSLMLEDNDTIIKIVELFGGTYYKRWRIYDLPLK